MEIPRISAKLTALTKRWGRNGALRLSAGQDVISLERKSDKIKKKVKKTGKVGNKASKVECDKKNQATSAVGIPA